MNHLRSERGVTLVELMIAVFTAGILLVMGMGVLLNISGTSNNFSLNLDNEIQEMQAMNALQLMFGQATEVKYRTSSLNSYSSASGVGALRAFDSNDIFTASEPVATLAVFMRDQQNSRQTSISTLSSNLIATGLYFQPPTSTTWGVMYLATGSSTDLKPNRSQLFYEGLVRMRILNVSTFTPDGVSPNVGDPVTSFDVELTFRRFLGDVKPEARLFCPEASISSCVGIGAYKDVSRVQKINLRNNILTRSPNTPDTSSVDYGGRMYDLIHFFGLGKTGDL